MKSLATEEAASWCERAGLTMNADGQLAYSSSPVQQFYIKTPDGFRGMILLARTVAIFGGEAGFSGGLLWLRRWDIGSPQLVRVAWQIMEDMRRAHGDMRSLDIAPAQAFRHDDLVALLAFLLQVMGHGLVADFVPASRHLLVHFKDNGQICFMTNEHDTFQQLLTTFERWNPTEEDPMIVKMRELERQHEKGSQTR